MALPDIMSLLYLIHAFLCCVFNGNYLGMTFEFIITFIYDSFWYNLLYVNLLISINRLSAVAFFHKYKQKWTVGAAKFLVGLCLLLGFASSAIFYSLAPFAYNVQYKVPMPYDFVNGNVELQTKIDMVLSFGTIFVIVAVYVGTVLLSIVNTKKFTGHARKSFIRELKMLVQCIIVVCVLICAEFFIYFPVIGDLTFIIAAVLTAGLNPVIYIILDTKLRKKFLFIIKLRKNESAVFVLSHKKTVNISITNLM